MIDARCAISLAIRLPAPVRRAVCIGRSIVCAPVETIGVPQAVTDAERQLLSPGSPFELVEVECLGEIMRIPKTRPRDLRELLVNSANFADREYMIATDGVTTRRYTVAEHVRLVASTAKVFREQYGVGHGDRVAILGANSPEWIIAFWATVSLGAIAVGLNGWWSGLEIEQGLADCEPKLLVADQKRLARLDGRDPGVPTVVMETDFEAVTLAHPEAKLSETPISIDDPCIILYTSGTTGFPKGAVHTHANICWLLSMMFFQGARSMISSPPAAGVTPTVQFCTSPLFHVSGLHTAAIAFLATGTKSIWWQGRFDVIGAARILERERCTGWSITETVLHRFVNHPDIHQFDLSSVRNVGGGGSPISPSLQARTREVFPGSATSMGLGYGLTESTAWATSNLGQELIDYPMSCGRPLVGVDIAIRDPDDIDGPELPLGDEGEVLIRSAGVMLEYWKRPDATADAIRPGRWLRTGDIGHFAGGRLYLSSRKRDLILRGGENVYPVEIEKRIEDHPDVSECAVFGVDDAEFGQAVKAVVVSRPGRVLDETTLADWVAGGLAYFKVPTHWEFRAEELPRNASGKILKDPLRTGVASNFIEE